MKRSEILRMTNREMLICIIKYGSLAFVLAFAGTLAAHYFMYLVFGG